MEAQDASHGPGTAVVTVPPVGGLATPLLGQLPLGLLVVAAAAGRLTTGLRVRTTRVAGGGAAVVRDTTVDLGRDRSFRALLEHLAQGGQDGNDQAWLSTAYRLAAAPRPADSDTAVELTAAASTAGLRCTVRCDPALLDPSWADRIAAGMLTARAGAAANPDRRLSDLAADAAFISATPARDDQAAAKISTRASRNLSTLPVPARTPVERRLVSLWREALAVDEVGIEDDFFELGGHSLLAAALVRQMREALGTDLPLDTLYLEPTIAALAAEIEASRVPPPVAEP